MNRFSRRTRSLNHWLVAAASLLAVACSTSSPGPSVVVGPTPVAPGPIVVSGVILETGTHAPVSAATVCWTRHCTTTGQDGSYQLNTETLPPSHTGPSNDFICPSASADGFEGKTLCVSVGSNAATFSAALQRQIVINAGDTVTG